MLPASIIAMLCELSWDVQEHLDVRDPLVQNLLLLRKIHTGGIIDVDDAEVEVVAVLLCKLLKQWRHLLTGAASTRRCDTTIGSLEVILVYALADGEGSVEDQTRSMTVTHTNARACLMK